MYELKKKIRQGLLFTQFPLLEKLIVERNTDRARSGSDVGFEQIRALFRWMTVLNH